MKLFSLKPIFYLFLVVILVYTLLVYLFHQSFSSTGTAYYNYLAEALMAGRFDVHSPNLFDLSEYFGKWYLYWGPSPVLFVLPFYWLFGISASDRIYGLIAGILNVVVLWFLLREVIKHFQLKVSLFAKVFLLLGFAFVSPNFYLSVRGDIWHINQIITALYVLLFYLFLFKYLNNMQKWLFLVLAVVFFTLGWMGRMSLVTNGLVFLYPLFLLWKDKRVVFLKVLFIIAAGTVLGISTLMAYNYSRFRNPFEVGYKYQNAADRYRGYIRMGKIFSKSFIPHNIDHYFLVPVSLSTQKPYVISTPEGNSVFSVYPFILVLVYLFGKQLFTKKQKIFLFLVGSVVVGNMAILLLHVGTGWVQFGSRYFFDLIPGIMVLSIFAVRTAHKPVLIALLLYGIVINVLGMSAFFGVI